MGNSVARAKQWTELIADRPEFPAGRALLAQFDAGQVESLCACGCNSYVFSPALHSSVPALASASGGTGSIFELLFRVGPGNETVEFLVFANAEGRLAVLDVHYCANSYPMPESVVLLEPPVHVRISKTVVA